MLLPRDLSALCHRLERAQALNNGALACAMAEKFPASGAKMLEWEGAVGIFLQEGHPLNQGLALGLGAPLNDEVLDALEALLGQGGHPIRLELTPGADLALGQRLVKRGYTVNQFQQVWVREMFHALLSQAPPVPPCAGISIRQIEPSELPLFCRVVQAGFADQNSLPANEELLVLQPLEAKGTTYYLAWEGSDPVAGGTLGLHDDIAVLTATAVMPRARGRGLQRALIARRLEDARLHNAHIAVASTVPWSDSATNLQRLGFQAAYPKLEWVKAPAGANHVH